MSRAFGPCSWPRSLLQTITGFLGPREKKPATLIPEPSTPQNTREDTQTHQASYNEEPNDRTHEPHDYYSFSEDSSLPSRSSTSQIILKEQTMPSEAKIDMSADTLKGVLTNIRAVTVSKKKNNKKFIPETLLAKVMNPTAVKGVLEEQRKKLDLKSTVTIDKLANFFSKEAFKIFAILATNNLFGLAEHFWQHDFQNDLLPVRKRWLNDNDDDDWEIESCIDGDQIVAEIREQIQAKVHQVFSWGDNSPWGETDNLVRQFCDFWQWEFVPPVFVEDRFRYEFPDEIHLPFTRIGEQKQPKSDTFYSYVQEMSIHADHLPKALETAMDDQNNHRVAIKQLKQSGPNFKKVAADEASVLEIMRELGEEHHLIKAIAYYQKGEDLHYFIFPWAELGNLWEFWTSRNKSPETDPDYMIWALTQLTGLASALEALHHMATDTDVNCRHGDLKPLNILCFKTEDGGNHNPRLVITDVGLARVHNEATRERGKTTTAAWTIRYAAPELVVDSNTTRSRRFDIWSFGCILLECVVWLLYGSKKLLEFAHDPEEPFYELLPPAPGFQTRDLSARHLEVEIKEKKTLQVHSRVQYWITYIKKHDWRYSKGTALQKLVDLIVDRMLKVDLGPLGPADRDNSIPSTRNPPSSPNTPGQIVTETMTKEPIPASQKSIPVITKTLVGEQDSTLQLPPPSIKRLRKARTWGRKGKATNHLSRDPQYRAYAPEVKEKLEAILEELENGNIEAFGSKPSNETAAAPGPSPAPIVGNAGGLGIPGEPDRTWQNEYRFTPLTDNWDYAPDDTIARKVLTGLYSKTILPLFRESSKLCHRCISLRLWSLNCTFVDSLAGLEEKANTEGCELCSLLLQGLQVRIKRHSDFVRFARIGSYLTIDDGQGQAFANLYKMPGFQNDDLQSIQLGLSRLPSAGSETHYKILREWIRSCDRTDQCYPKHLDFLPTRLLDVSSSDSKTIRLLDIGRGNTVPRRYIALSHRWGSPEHNTKFCTYKSNIEDFKLGINISRLPKTFQDAVNVTRGLGLGYLWIDSLCIVQDDENDWEAEAKLMGRVFSSAYCTIAASCASGSSDGFLKPRQGRRTVVMQGPQGDEIFCVCEAIDDFYRDVDQGELNQRGWVLQERALSRRTIYFTETQSYWECGGGVRCETMTKMKNRKASFLGDSNFPNSAEKYVKGMRIELFQDLYERYSRLNLSFPSDRPIAIKGLESRLIDTFGTTGGYGVFDKYLHRCLLWQRAGKALKHIEAFRGGKLVPSWSWMAYDGPIRYTTVPFGEASWNGDITSPFTKTGQALRGSEHEGDGISTSMLELETPVWDIFDTKDGQIILDNPSRTIDQALQCVVVGNDKTTNINGRQAYYVLLVLFITNINENHVYERVGVGVLDRRHIALDGKQRMAKIR